MKVENAKTMPKIFYGLHMVEGVAEYKEPQTNNGEPYRIFVGEDCIKNMDSTFPGKPLYVHHVNDVNLDNIQNEADGYVVESFFNKNDGKHWVKFIVVSDQAHEAVKRGWKLSNAYLIKKASGGGMWHGVEYLKEVQEGEYEHLALVPNPRYEESIILTPEEFKEYNTKKEIELKKLYNSKKKEEKKSMFSFFKKTKVENTADFENTSVVLPKSGVEKTLSLIINEADESEMKNKEDMQMCNEEHYAMVGEEKMKVNELIKKYQEMKMKQGSPEHEKKESPSEEKKEHEPKNQEEPAKEDKKEEEEKKEIHVDIDSHKEENMSDEEAKKKALELAKHEDDEMEEKKEKKQNHFDLLKNAESNAITATQTIELSEDRVARGKARYGSN